MNKEHIIDEIIRTTKANDGVPLGEAKFKKETGISRYDWKGKYWTKWGDAVKDAGYEANEFTSAYDKKWLIEQLILLIRELKKYPTSTEIQMKSYSTENFPAFTTISARLGKKGQQIKNVLDYCKDKDEYQDIIELCNEETQKCPEKEEQDFHPKADLQDGYVYLMKSGRYYKIGRSICVEKRNYEIGIKLPEELQTIHTIRTDDPVGIEAYWHKRFEDKRKKGEWFDLSSGDIRAF